MSNIVNILMSGVSNMPNDYACEEGAMSVSINAVQQGGSIRPVMPGTEVTEVGTLSEDTDVVAVHQVGNMKHYILLEESMTEAESRPNEPPFKTITLYYQNVAEGVKVWWGVNYEPWIADNHMKVSISVAGASTGLTINTSRDEASLIPAGQITVNGQPYSYATNRVTRDDVQMDGYEELDGDVTEWEGSCSSEEVLPNITISYACLSDRVRIKWTSDIDSPIETLLLRIGIEGACAEGPAAIGKWTTYDPAQIGIRKGEDGSVIKYDASDETKRISQEHIKIVSAGEVTTPEDVIGEVTYISTDSPVEEVPDRAEGGTLYYVDVDDETKTPQRICDVDGLLQKVTPIGNILVLSCKDKPLSYLFWKDGKYRNLGSSFPDFKATPYVNTIQIGVNEMHRKFGVSYDDKTFAGSALDKSESSTITINEDFWEKLMPGWDGEREFYHRFNDEEKSFLYNLVFSRINVCHNTLAREGYFYAPFFVRFALRLYDGKHVMHTPPCLMIPSSDGKPIMMVATAMDNKTGIDDLEYQMLPIVSGSRLCADMSIDLGEWKDLVTHVDVFVSAPIINYTDSSSAIVGAYAANLPYRRAASQSGSGQNNDAAGAVRPIGGGGLRAWYMKGQDRIGSVLEDFYDGIVAENNGQEIEGQRGTNYRARIQVTKARYEVNRKYLNDFKTEMGDKYILVNKKKYPHVTAANQQGHNLQQASRDTVIAYRWVNKNKNRMPVMLGDAYLPNLEDYQYIILRGNAGVGEGGDFEGEEEGEFIPEPTKENTYLVFSDPTREDGEGIDVIEVSYDKRKDGALRRGSVIIDLQRADGHGADTEDNSMDTQATAFSEAITENNTYHLVKSFKVEDLKDGYSGDLMIDREVLNVITTRQPLEDNGQMREEVVSDIPPFEYNNRLSVCVKSKSLPETTGMINFCIKKTEINTGVYTVLRAWIKATVNNQDIYKEIPTGNTDERTVCMDDIRYFSYPCSEATDLITLCVSYNVEKKQFRYRVDVYNMVRHRLMNAAYIYNNMDLLAPKTSTEYNSFAEAEKDPAIAAATAGRSDIRYNNMVRISNADNPFYYNEVNQVTLPARGIIGMSTSAKALSQGQMGSFPLYCFSDNGIWALEVSETGTYSAKQSISRAVCTSARSITQTEGEVLFVTKRGLMSLDGATVRSISQPLEGHNKTNDLHKLKAVMSRLGMHVDIPTHIEAWLQDAQFLYDDKRQFVYVYKDRNENKENEPLGYVYSVPDQSWGMFLNNISHSLPSYTDALVVTNAEEGKRKLINMSEYETCGTKQKSLLVTRPLTMSAADTHKTIESLTLRGAMDTSDVKIVIWASNDLDTWRIVGTSSTSWYRGNSGTPYKYYRIGMLAEWSDGESLTGISADITPRVNNRLR